MILNIIVKGVTHPAGQGVMAMLYDEKSTRVH